PFRIVVDLGEPAVQFCAGHLRTLVDRHEEPFRDRVVRRIAPGRFHRRFEDRNRLLEGGYARSARTHPAIGERAGAAHRVWVTDTHPDRQAGLLHRFRPHRAALELKDITPVVDARLAPQCADQLDLLAKAPYPTFTRNLKLGVVM